MSHKVAIISNTMEIFCMCGSEIDNAQKVQLNASEFRMFVFLLHNRQSISNRTQLLEKGWPGKCVTENSLNVSIMKLRKKIDSLCCDIQVKTYLGEGYKLIVSSDVQILEYDSHHDLAVDKAKEQEQVEFLIENEAEHIKTEAEIQSDNNRKQIDKIDSKQTITLKGSVPVFHVENKSRLIGIFVAVLCVSILFFSFYMESFSEFTCSDSYICSALSQGSDS